MNNKHTAVIAVLIFVIVFLAIALFFVALHPTRVAAPSPTASSTAATSTTPAVGAQDMDEHGQYYDVTAAYPGSTPLLQSASQGADAAAVASMKAYLAGATAQFKKDANVGNLTAADIAMQGLDQGRKYALDITYTSYQGPHTVSYVFTASEDTLGAHPNTTYKTFTFDRATGMQLSLSDLFAGTTYLSTLSAIARADLPNIVSAQQGSPADLIMLGNGTKPTAANFSDWYFDGSNFVLLFPPYQVGPYALGTVKDPIAPARLTGLKAQYR